MLAHARVGGESGVRRKSGVGRKPRVRRQSRRSANSSVRVLTPPLLSLVRRIWRAQTVVVAPRTIVRSSGPLEQLHLRAHRRGRRSGLRHGLITIGGGDDHRSLPLACPRPCSTLLGGSCAITDDRWKYGRRIGEGGRRGLRICRSRALHWTQYLRDRKNVLLARTPSERVVDRNLASRAIGA